MRLEWNFQEEEGLTSGFQKQDNHNQDDTALWLEQKGSELQQRKEAVRSACEAAGPSAKRSNRTHNFMTDLIHHVGLCRNAKVSYTLVYSQFIFFFIK